MSSYPVRLSSEGLNAVKSWSQVHNGCSGTETSFVSMIKLAQKLTGTLRPADSLEIVEAPATSAQEANNRNGGNVVGRNFLSFLYRDAKGLEPQASQPTGEEHRPFGHADVFRVPRHQFEFLLFARQRAVTFGADPSLTIHDVAAAIVGTLEHVSNDGGSYRYADKDFKIRRAASGPV